MRFLAHLIANGLAVIVLAKLIPDHVAYRSYGAVVVFAIVLGLLNAFIRPVLRLITLPLTCLTFGLFAIVVNAVVFYAAAWFSTGVEITYLGALAGTIVVSVLSGVITELFDGNRKRKW